MRPVKAAELKHIKSVGDAKFGAALARATIITRRDSRLTGLDKIREPLAFEAALVGTGFKSGGFFTRQERNSK